MSAPGQDRKGANISEHPPLSQLMPPAGEVRVQLDEVAA
jgi:hypothetical protein